MRKFLKIGLVAILFLTLATPALAAIIPDHIVPDCGPCSFNDLVRKGGLIDNIIQFLTFAIAIPLATLVILYGGIQMILSPATPSSREQGKKIIWAAVIGLIFTLAGYLIIKAIIEVSASGEQSGQTIQQIFTQ